MSDHTDLAMVLERVSSRARSEGAEADRTTRSWADTIRAASYGDEKGTNRWEVDAATGNVVPVPQDPTGDAAVDPDEVAQMNAQLHKAMRSLHRAAADYENILDQASHDPMKRPHKPDTQLDEDRWCRSCKADRGHLEPVAVHPDGRIRYNGECRWCHDFKAEYGRYPTPTLLRRHHAGLRISEAHVTAALTPQQRTA